MITRLLYAGDVGTPVRGDVVESTITGFTYQVDRVFGDGRVRLHNIATHITIKWCTFNPVYFRFVRHGAVLRRS